MNTGRFRILAAIFCIVQGVLFGCHYTGYAQNVKFTPVVAPFSQHTITQIVQDNNGFLWIGTASGLNRYDGSQVYTFGQDGTHPELNNVYVQSLFVDSKGRVWVGTFGEGVFRYDVDSDTFAHFQNEPGNFKSIAGNNVEVIYEDSEGKFWIGSQREGVNVYDEETDTFLHFRYNNNDPYSISGNFINAICEDGQGNLWLGTWGSGLNLFDKATQRFIRYNHEPSDFSTLSSNRINKLFKDHNGDIWVATQNGLNKISVKPGSDFEINRIDIGSEQRIEVVTSLIENGNELWVGVENGGIRILRDSIVAKYEANTNDKFSIQDNSVWSLFKDNAGIIWVGTFSKGLFKYDKNEYRFEHYEYSSFSNSVAYNNISDFIENPDGSVWVATDGGGLSHWNPTTNNFKTFSQQPDNSGSISSNYVLSLLNHNGELWAGTWLGGINIFKESKGEFEKFPLVLPPGSESNLGHIFDMVKDRQGNIWIAAYRDGIYVYHPESGKFTYFSEEKGDLSSNLVRNMVVDAQGDIWIGTEGRGLIRASEENGAYSFTHYMHNPNMQGSISHNNILSLYKDKRGRIWIGTVGGLNLFDYPTSSFIKMGNDQIVASSVVNGILEDEYGYIWVSTNNGIYRLDEFGTLKNSFDETDGLQSSEFKRNSFYKLSNGQLLFGGINGFNKIDPRGLQESKLEPPLYLTDFYLNNQRIKPGANSILEESILHAERLDLEYFENDFNIEFALLEFTKNAKVRYAYKLENYNEDWLEIGSRRSAYFTNVPPGTYVFKVRASQSEGEWGEQMAQITIHVAKPWYGTYWAYAIYGLTALALVLIAFQITINRVKLQNQYEIEHVKLVNEQQLNQVKTQFFTNISHEFRTPLTLILSPLKAMAENPLFKDSRDQIEIMLRNAQKLLNLINQLLDLSKAESGNMKLEATLCQPGDWLKPLLHSFSNLANKKNITLQIEMPEQTGEIYLDRDKFEKIVGNLVSNAIKYTPEFGKVYLRYYFDKTDFVLEVSDTGVGIPTEELEYVFNRYYRVNNAQSKLRQGTGIGLSLTKELVIMHGGTIDVKSDGKTGAEFTVRIPLGKAHLDPSEILSDRDNKPTISNTELDVPYTVEESNSEEEPEEDGKPVILVIEDNEDIRNYLNTLLKAEYHVLTADNGNRGLKLASNRIPDLIITDIMMPGLDGYELCEQLKTNDVTSHIPVVMLTAKASNESIEMGFEKGADYFITKPFVPKILQLRVHNILKTKEKLKQNLLSSEQINLSPKEVKINTKDREFLNKAVKIVEDFMSDSNFYVDDLGRELGLSRMQLYRKLKGLIGQSANEFIRTLRLKRAAQLIEQDALTISEITYEVGFTDLQYFRDCFKKQYGMNPSEFHRTSLEKE